MNKNCVSLFFHLDYFIIANVKKKPKIKRLMTQRLLNYLVLYLFSLLVVVRGQHVRYAVQRVHRVETRPRPV